MVSTSAFNPGGTAADAVRSRRATVWAIPALVLAIGLALTVLGVYWFQSGLDVEARARYERQAARIEDDLLRRFNLPVYGLNGLRGLYATSGQIGREAFRDYVESRQLNLEFPGVRGFGFIERVKREDAARFTAAERADAAPDFELRHSAGGDDLYIAKFIEPLASNRAAWGFDIASEAVRREALERAVRTGEPTLSGRITLVQDGRRGPGLLYIVPVWRRLVDPASANPRINALRGFLFAPIVVGELCTGIANVADMQLDFELYDAGQVDPARLLFGTELQGDGDPGAAPRVASDGPLYQSTRYISVGGRTLALRTSTTAAFERGLDRTTPTLLAAAGTLLSSLLALAAWLLVSGRARAESLAAEMTADLERLAKVVRHTSNSVAILDAQRYIVWVNEGFERLFGFTLAEARGHKPGDLTHSERLDPEQMQRLRELLDSGQAFRGELQKRRKDGREICTHAEVQPLHDARGQLTGFMSIESDITDQKVAKERLEAALRDTDVLLRTINLHAIVSVTDRRGLILEANAALVQISGYPIEELLGQDHRLLGSGQHPRSFWVEVWRTIASGRSWRGEICNRTKDGRLYWVDSIIAPFLNAQGRIEKYVAISNDITASKTAAAELALQRERLANIIEGTHVATWEWNVQTGVSHFNERWAEIVGYTLEELQPTTIQTWLKLAHPDDLARGQALLQRHFDGELDYYEVESRTRHKDGRWMWVLGRGRLSTRTPDGKPEWMVGTHMDITQRKLAEQALQQTLQRFVLAADSAGIGVWEMDVQHRTLSWDDWMYRLYGRARVGEFAPYSLWSESVHPEDLPTAQQELAQAISGEREFNTEFRILWLNGEVRHLRASARVVRNARGQAERVIGINFDITARKRAELELGQTSALLSSVLDSASEVAVIGTDMDLKITVFNIGAQRLLGYTAQEVVGHCTPEIFHDPAEIEVRLEQLSQRAGRRIRGRGVFVDPVAIGDEHEWTYIAKSGQRTQVALTVTAMTAHDGRPIGYLGVAHDVTRHKLYQESLKVAMQKAEQANLAKSQFLANMSHELRTPMNAILGMLQLLQKTQLSARQWDYTRKTEGAARSLLGLLNDILDFSKVEAGKMSLAPHPFRTDTLLRELSVILSGNLGQKEIELVFDIDPGLPPVLVGDALRLQQVLINLGGNALKFTERGEVVVSLRVLEQLPGAVRLLLQVRDTGIGIAETDQRHIFEAFAQAEASTTRRFGGTGLGLSISQRLVQMMGGELRLSSHPGRGSCFQFELELPVADDVLPRLANRVDAGPLRTLIVDDNAIAREVLGEMARSMQWQVDVASSGAQALQMVQARLGGPQAYQLVLLDWQMPGMDGWDTNQRLRELCKPHSPPLVVMITAHGREMLAERGADEQALLQGFLVKPVTASMLLDAVVDAQVRASQPDPVATIARPEGVLPGAGRLRGLHLLVVEDNANNRQVAQELLGDEGAEVQIATQGREGVDAVLASLAPGGRPFDAVLMDVQMPVLDGYGATAEIRRHGAARALPIIAMTANAMQADRQACLDAGMSDHVGKPFDLDQLVACLLKHTSGGGLPVAKLAVASEPGADLHRDVDAALARMGGNRRIYLRVLESFQQNLALLPEQLSTLLGADAAGDAERLAEAMNALHSLKGIASTLGLNALAACAARAEQALRQPDGAAPAAEVLATVQAAVQQGQRDIASLLPVMRGRQAEAAAK
ncbi:MAG: PAS domain S-box protein [Burkholderiaceae bacterium]|nr:PAS domain S-box protein [Burkholderiaceae bacterium]